MIFFFNIRHLEGELYTLCQGWSVIFTSCSYSALSCIHLADFIACFIKLVSRFEKDTLVIRPLFWVQYPCTPVCPPFNAFVISADV